ncbi:MAG TPA: excinuclease ABC subunit UvrA [Planctomycetota bacterium]|nr:excinuclease ABC subunit UvrA [Planctomycetota bacterium]
MTNYISIRGAKEHNLRNINIDIPRDKLIVVTGVSGSGKTSLAFDTIYAEGQRRYIESLSAYARQFLEQIAKPDVESIEGLPPTISIEQRGGTGTPRSIVATTTEIYDYLRVIFARLGEPFCPKCDKPIVRQSAQQIIQHIQGFPAYSRIIVLSPIIRGKKGEHRETFERIRRNGFVRVRVDNKVIELGSSVPKLDKYKRHNIEIVIDRLTVSAKGEPSSGGEPTGIEKSRLADSVETALRLGEGLVIISHQPEGKRFSDLVFSEHFACPDCQISLSELSPRIFSFNSPYGACPRCNGLGTRMELDMDLIVPDNSLSLANGAIEAWRKSGHRMAIYYSYVIKEFAGDFGIDMDTPFYNLPEDKKRILMYGTNPADESKTGKSFTGVIPDLENRFYKTQSDAVKHRIHSYMSELPCPTCKGARLKPEPLAVRIGGKNISEVIRMSVKDAYHFFDKLTLTEEQTFIGHMALKEIKNRLSFLVDVGLSYLTLDRRSLTLSGGEAQRIRLASQVGSGLVGVCYVLDEPTIGLHQRDNQRLLNTLIKLRNLGNTVIVVEHDEDTIRASDYLIDVGPGAGTRGGQIIISAPSKDILNGKATLNNNAIKSANAPARLVSAEAERAGLPSVGTSGENNNNHSLTLQYLTNKLRIELPKKRRFDRNLFPQPNAKNTKPNNNKLVASGANLSDHNWLTIVKAREFNLKDINVPIPLGCFTCVTGVSGSGKSTLVNEILYKGLMKKIYKSRIRSGECADIIGAEYIDKVIIIDQSPIGRTPRSNPATYTGVFDEIRKVFAMTKEARLRGYQSGRFSFNLKAGRCAGCQGQGTKLIEMHFLPDVYITCEQCKGKRYNRETLDITYRGKNIADVLEMEVSSAVEFFQNFPHIVRVLKTLDNVGLGYIALGQSSITLSGGEAQRVKLSAELGKSATNKTLYILDEPTTGLHFSDINKLLNVLNRLVDRGNSVVVIEHNMHVIKMADYIVDLGPEGGDAGGFVVASGTPEEIVKNERSYTGKILKKYL